MSDVTPGTDAEALWWPVVSQARWFQGKSREGWPDGWLPLPWLVDTPELKVRPEVLTVAYADGDERSGAVERYQLLVTYRELSAATSSAAAVGVLTLDDGVAYEVSDAPRDPEAMAAVLEAIMGDRVFGPDSPTPVESTYARPMPMGDRSPRVFTGEQSNTNVLYGDTALLKVFRKLEHGPNLDREITDRLLGAGITDVPVLYGWVSALIGPGQPDDLMMLTELLPDPEDGWEIATDAVRTGSDFTADATALGRALGEIHAALAGDDEDGDGEELADLMAHRLAAAVAAAPALSPYEAGLAARFEALRGRRLPVQSIHGDFHLGQTLRTRHGWRIIDFEGEPLKSMAERRRPDSPWRDVAGMLRSLSYATSAAPDPQGAVAAEWLQSAREAFLTAYRETAGTDADQTVLTAYEADKAAYEVVYETRNRPDWVHIPLGAVATLTTSTATPRS